METTSFSGNFSHTIDPKGRVTIPSLFRIGLGSCFTVGMNTERTAIALYPQPKWMEIKAQLDGIPITDRRGQQYVRMVNSSSFTDCDLDGQGRVLLPAYLRQRLNMDKNIRFVGMGNYLEVWDDELYAVVSGEAEEHSEDLTDYVFEQYFKPHTQGN